jgi:hypothetical protein
MYFMINPSSMVIFLYDVLFLTLFFNYFLFISAGDIGSCANYISSKFSDTASPEGGKF